jgi:hypothetical protein
MKVYRRRSGTLVRIVNSGSSSCRADPGGVRQWPLRGTKSSPRRQGRGSATGPVSRPWPRRSATAQMRRERAFAGPEWNREVRLLTVARGIGHVVLAAEPGYVEAHESL